MSNQEDFQNKYDLYLKQLAERFGSLPETKRKEALRALEMCLSQTLFIGQDLRTLREDRGLTQVQLAAKLNTTQSYISQIECRVINPPLKYLDWLSGAQ